MVDGGVGAGLRAARERLGWSRETLAHHSGVSWSAITQIETGRRKDIRLSSLTALATALGVTVDHLLDPGSAPTSALFGHRALMYGSEAELGVAARRFLAEGVERSDRMLVVTTESGTRLLRNALGTDGRDVEFADAVDWYSTPRAAVSRYRRFLEDNRDAHWVRILAEAVWSGRSPPEAAVWTRYEAMMNLVFAGARATVVCAYGTRSASAAVLADAQLTHPAIESAGTVVASASYRDPEDLLLESP